MFTISSRQIVGIYISKKCTNNEKCQKKKSENWENSENSETSENSENIIQTI